MAQGRAKQLAKAARDVEARCDRIQMALGRIEARQTANGTSLADAEFGVFSQWGEDGIVQWLIKSVPIDKRVFVEFGVQDYSESNTRFLLTNNNWSAWSSMAAKAISSGSGVTISTGDII